MTVKTTCRFPQTLKSFRKTIDFFFADFNCRRTVWGNRLIAQHSEALKQRQCILIHYLWLDSAEQGSVYFYCSVCIEWQWFSIFTPSPYSTLISRKRWAWANIVFTIFLFRFRYGNWKWNFFSDSAICRLNSSIRLTIESWLMARKRIKVDVTVEEVGIMADMTESKLTEISLVGESRNVSYCYVAKWQEKNIISEAVRFFSFV